MDENHERRKEILGFIYKMGKSNKNLTAELFDDHVQSKLEEDIENFQF
jgi:methionine salvage enolase-phosphatase E1